MGIFLLLAAGLVALALGLLLRPLLRKTPVSATGRDSINVSLSREQLAELDADLARGLLSQDRYAEARRDIELRLAEDLQGTDRQRETGRPGRLWLLIVGLGVPALAAGLYLKLGTPAALDPAKRLGMTEQQASERQKMLDLTARLAARMQEKPDDPQGWVMLARAYRALEKIPESAKAYARAAELNPRDAGVQADYAETLVIVQRGRFDGEPLRLARRALELDPKSEKALALLGTAAFDARDFKSAIAYWERLLALAPPGTDYARAVEGGIAQARQELSRPAAPPAKVAGRVTLSAALAKEAAPGDSVFVFARAAKGPPMPLAVLRKQVKDLPFDFALDESMAMAPGLSLGAFDSVVVGARISKRGNPMPAAGDLEGLSAPVKPGTTGIAITIDRKLP
ncbi:MAG: c-type cytochrome biogenesis protein CcmI [Burkholderiales bacterium]